MAKSVTLSDKAYKILLDEKNRRGNRFFSETIILLTNDLFSENKKHFKDTGVKLEEW